MTDSDFREAFHTHKDVVFRFAFRMTRSVATAEDIVQDAFVILWRRPGAVDPARGTLRSFLLGAARNLILKRWRKDRPQEPLDHDRIPDLTVDIASRLESLDRADAVARALEALPPLQREALILAEYEELSLSELARVTGADLAAVKSRLNRARQNLRRLLAQLLETNKGTAYGT